MISRGYRIKKNTICINAGCYDTYTIQIKVFFCWVSLAKYLYRDKAIQVLNDLIKQ